jgi:hypothetical protein
LVSVTYVHPNPAFDGATAHRAEAARVTHKSDAVLLAEAMAWLLLPGAFKTATRPALGPNRRVPVHHGLAPVRANFVQNLPGAHLRDRASSDRFLKGFQFSGPLAPLDGPGRRRNPCQAGFDLAANRDKDIFAAVGSFY